MLSRIAGLFGFRTVRFVFSGGVAFVTVMSLLYVFTDILGFWYLFSFIVAFFIATTVSFTLQKLFTFGDSTFGTRRVSGQAALFVSLALFNLGANSALLYALVEYGEFHYLFAQLFVSLVIAIWNFLCYRYIFRAVEMGEPESLLRKKSWRERFPRELFLPLGACILAIAIAFTVSGVYNDRIDTAQYVGEIGELQAFMTTGEPVTGRAMFKPLPGIVGGLLSFVVHPYMALLLINIVLNVGFVVALYGVLRELAFNRLYAAIGASWAALGYPVLKYGLGLGTDAWGWFIATLVVFLALRAVRTGRLYLVLAASVLGFLGSLAKETAVLGLLFAGLYFLAMLRPWGMRKTVLWVATLSAPFFVMQALLLSVVITSGGPTFLDWYAQNEAGFTGYRTVAYFIGVMFSTFNVLLLFAFAGLVVLWRAKELFTFGWLRTYVPLFVGMLPVLLWPVFVSRIIYIQVLWIIPLALYGVRAITAKFPAPLVRYALFAFPPLVAIALYAVSGNGSLFDVLMRYV